MQSTTYNIDDIRKYIEGTDPAKEVDNDFLVPDPERNKHYHLQQLLTYHSHRTLCVNAVEELRSIITKYGELDTEEVRIWVDRNVPFFKEHLFSFGYTYKDEDGNLEKDFYLPDYSIYIDRTPFVPIIQYWLLMKNLYFGEYYKKKEDRSPTEAADPKDYYYVEPDPDAPTDLEIVKNILELK